MNCYHIGNVLGEDSHQQLGASGIFHETHVKRQLPKYYEGLKSPKYYERSSVGLNVVGGGKIQEHQNKIIKKNINTKIYKIEFYQLPRYHKI